MTAAPAAPDTLPPPESDGPGAPGALALRYAKTEAGRAEVRGRTLALSRQARNLLLIIEPGRPAAAWAAMVQGCGLTELQALLDAGLVTAAAAGAAASAQTAAPADRAATLSRLLTPVRLPLAQALAQHSYRALYDRITALARPQLGLFKGYRLILEVERCSGPDALRALAQRFVEQVRDADGDAAAQALADQLTAAE